MIQTIALRREWIAFIDGKILWFPDDVHYHKQIWRFKSKEVAELVAQQIALDIPNKRY